jgi:transcriptional regulator PpsR
LTKPPAAPADLGALSHLAPELAQTLASVAGDIALVVDVNGVIRDVALGGGQPLPAAAKQWIGQRWAETVSDDARGKIEQLLQEAVAKGVSRRREVSLPLDGSDVPVAYTAVRLGEYGPVLAVGRDLRAVAAIQQRFVDTQQQMEREYWKKRQAESRYRMLFQVATDAVLVVDAQTLQVTEANRAAAGLFDLPLEALVGRPVTAAIERGTRPGIEALLAQARESGRPAEARARLANRVGVVSISAAPFRSEGALQLLVRARAADPPPRGGAAADATIAELVERIPDGVVITDAAGRVLTANPAFVALCRADDEAQVKGLPLAHWLGESDHDQASILAQVSRHGIAPQVSTAFRAGDGTAFDVELSAALLDDAEQQTIGFTIRRLAQRSPIAPPALDELSRAVQQLSVQLGQLPLPGLLRQATELAERHFIVAAVERAGRDLGRAAAVLGVSRRSLELRLQRHGLLAGDAPANPRDDD